MLVELAMLHRYGIITTFLFSKYASPIFAQKKTEWQTMTLDRSPKDQYPDL